ncbi:hypothetical protein QBC34DRAFT_386845 [Podospora aff. communis PSN243]|uniref:Uncharacterized protein n=1 Tax=Podospora aff. communis PSN243 TaxID=3040156 RepID=A0AAV9G4Y3_9PEZI|nr:hypothetical protein QBC34DRAFT_386845 [Podospora aff. communis PSN243]
MTAARTAIMRTALTPLRAQSGAIRLRQFSASQVRYVSGGEPTTTEPTNPRQQPPGVGEKGTAKEYNKDGTNPNKNIVYAGLAAVTMGAILYVSMSPKKERDLDKSKASAAR